MARIRTGIIGMEIGRSWGAVAHVPALRALPDYDITAVGTTRQVSADAAAAHFGIPHAFADHEALVNSPEVDLVAITVKVPHHLELVTAAIAAGKHVYCEWPLGNGLAEAETMAALARARGVKAVVGLQARSAPAFAFVRDLVAQNYVGEVLSSSLIGTGLAWGAFVDRPNAYTADRGNGATMLTIPVGHTLDAICHALGEVTDVSALIANRRTTITLAETGEALPLTSEDQVAFVARLAGGAVLSAHYIGGVTKGTGLLWEINGTLGDLRITGAGGHAQIVDLAVAGAGKDDPAMAPLAVPESYYSTTLRRGPALNVAEAYARLARDLRDGTSSCPTFDDAVVRHRMIAAIEESSVKGGWCSL